MLDRETLRQLLMKVLELRREVQKLIDQSDQPILDTIIEYYINTMMIINSMATQIIYCAVL